MRMKNIREILMAVELKNNYYFTYYYDFKKELVLNNIFCILNKFLNK